MAKKNYRNKEIRQDDACYEEMIERGKDITEIRTIFQMHENRLKKSFPAFVEAIKQPLIRFDNRNHEAGYEYKRKSVG